MISIVTGTLNRKHLLPLVLENTIFSSDKVELILVDGGSVDGTIEYLKSINHPNLKLIEIGNRSPYSHYMNIGIKASKFDWICQWNDDALLVNTWEDVISEIDNSDYYLFNWKYGKNNDTTNPQWIHGTEHKNGWCLYNTKKENGAGGLCVNYGLYNKKIFKHIGMYNNAYSYYYCDSDMAERAWYFGYKPKNLFNIKVNSVITPKVAIPDNIGESTLKRYIDQYKNKILDIKNIEILK